MTRKNFLKRTEIVLLSSMLPTGSFSHKYSENCPSYKRLDQAWTSSVLVFFSQGEDVNGDSEFI